MIFGTQINGSLFTERDIKQKRESKRREYNNFGDGSSENITQKSYIRDYERYKVV